MGRRVVARVLWRRCAALAAVAWILATATSGTAAEPRGDVKAMPPAVEAAVRDSLVWLAARQHDDGSFGTGNLRGNVAVTALAGMAFMSGGSTPDRGPHGNVVTRIVDNLIAHTEPSGFIIHRAAVSQGPMYGHGFATMFLAECHGMSRSPQLREKLAAALKLIVDSQNREGGWRYWPNTADADVSVTVCQVMALRTARNAGLAVPKATIDRSTEYVKKCQNPDGGFTYMLGDQRSSEFPRSAAGVVALYSAGIYKGPEIDKGLNYLVRFTPGSRQTAAGHTGYYEYGLYYAAQAMWQAGGDRWRKWYPAACEDLLARRVRSAPHWTSPYSDDYATAMACIVLQMPNDCLPIFQR